MRIVRFAYNEAIHYGVLDDSKNSILLIEGDPLYKGVHMSDIRINVEKVNFLAPMIPRSKIINIKSYNTEKINDINMFCKPNTSIIGYGDPIRFPCTSKKIISEVKLAIIIGKLCKNISEEYVKNIIYGYSCSNDINAYDSKLYNYDNFSMQFSGFDGSCSLGPWIETDVDFPNLKAFIHVNKKVIYNNNIFHIVEKDIYKIISYISNISTLLPGDIILIGSNMFAEIECTANIQEIELMISNLGILRNPIIS